MANPLKIFGIPVCADSRDEFLRAVLAQAGAGRQIAVATLNAEMAVAANRNKEFHKLLCERMLVIPDGRRIAVTARKIYGVKLEVYPGIEFACDLVKSTAFSGNTESKNLLPETERVDAETRGASRSVFLLGSKPGVAEKAAKWLKVEIPGVRIAGLHHGFFKGEDERVVEKINKSGATFLLAGLGSPFQEFWIEKYRGLLMPRVLVGVGGSFEVWARIHRRAPGWISSLGLEWLYRALADPKRLRRLTFIPEYLAMERSEVAKSRDKSV